MSSAQVRAGPDALPGAVAVEDEQGRMLSLATLAPEVRLSLNTLCYSARS